MSSTSRHTFLDLFRALFVLLMVEGHLVRALLEDGSRSSGAFHIHEILHGITAPGFLFTSGFALAIASHRKRAALQSFSPALVRRLWRAAGLILLGYALHIPYWSLTKTLTTSTAAEWGSFISFGILQLIGTTILMIRLLFYTIRKEAVFLGILGGLFLAVVYLTPTIWDPEVTGSLPDVLRAALSGRTGSPFPIFPFAGFLIAGTLVSWVFLDQAGARGEQGFMRLLALTGVILTAAGAGMSFMSAPLLGETEFWYTSPSYFWIRLGILLFLMSSFWFFEHVLQRDSDLLRFRPGWAVTLGRESYFVYIVHLFLIFGWLLNPFMNVRAWLGGELTWFPALVATACLTGILSVLAWAWHLLKKDHPLIIQGLLSWFWITMFYYIVVNPF